MDDAQWPQEIGLVKPFPSPPFTFSPSMEDMIMVPSSSAAIMTPQLMERRTRPRKEQQSLPCPRCNSINTKFCYYNNYSLTQPRYFCKACRRYWTEGGSLRNVPVGGGSRKNKKSMITTTATTTTNNSSSTSASNAKKLPDPTGTQVINPSTFYGNNSSSINNQSSSAYSYVQVQDGDGSGVLYPNGGGLGFQSFLSGTANFPMVPRMLPFENLAHVPQAFDQSRDHGSEHNSPGFWNGVVGGGGNSW